MRHRHPHDRDCAPPRHWRHRWPHGHGGEQRVWYLKWRLQRRIFLFSASTILITLMAVGFILRAFGFAIHKPSPAHALAATFVACAILWTFSRKMSHRIAAPLAEFERVLRQFDTGDMHARIQLTDRRMQVGEMPLIGHAINEMADRIDKQLSDQRALLATVSHEIRTPLARMRLLVEFARDDEKKRAQHLDELDSEIVGVDALVSELLAASRIDFGALRRTELVAGVVGKQALERVGPAAAVLDDQSAGATFMGDATLVARAVGNLLENAKRHAGGAACLRITLRGSRIAFEVDDDGPGFAPGEQEQVFQPFYRSANSQAEKPGSVGLGLALVKRIAEAHGGRAYAQNRVGGGARVGIELALS